AQLESRLHLRRRLNGGPRMTDALTRQELLRRAAAGGAFLSVPGILAACGGSSTKSASSTSNHTLAKTLHFSNWPLYIDTNNKTHSRPSLQQFQKKYGVHVQYKIGRAHV